MLKIGKIDRIIFKKYVKPYLPLSELYLDSNVLDRIEDREIVVSSNPALGLPIETLGFFAFHYSVSNIAVAFAKPRKIVVTILLPPKSSEDDLKIICSELGDQAKKYGVKVIGGHTGVYKGIIQPIINVTSIGYRFREPLPPSPGDKIILIDKIGRETVWLKSLTGEISVEKDFWRGLTPLPKALILSSEKEIKLLHDISEGGLLEALLEISHKYNVLMKIDSKKILVDHRVLDEDFLRTPSYGALIAVASNVKNIIKICLNNGFEYSIIGEVSEGYGVKIDGKIVRESFRTSIDEIYGEYTYTLDPIINKLLNILKRIEESKVIVKLIPEVGMNMVYAREKCRGVDDIAGLSGRIVKSMGKPLVCGKVVYGGSKHLGLLLFHLNTLNRNIRACVNIRANSNIIKALKNMGINVVEVGISESKMGCPIIDFIIEKKIIAKAYYHPGARGIEPSIVILGKDPLELFNILVRVAENV